MHQTLLLAAYGWLTVFGLAHFLVDVVARRLRNRHDLDAEAVLSYGLHSLTGACPGSATEAVIEAQRAHTARAVERPVIAAPAIRPLIANDRDQSVANIAPIGSTVRNWPGP